MLTTYAGVWLFNQPLKYVLVLPDLSFFGVQNERLKAGKSHNNKNRQLSKLSLPLIRW